MEKHEVVPDVLDKAPPEVLQVTYLSGVPVDMGNELTPAQVKDVPTVTWMADPGAFYTLCMIDLDAPSRQQPQFREINHWLVMNIPGSRLDQGDCLAEYRGSGPPKGTGLHRYVFLLYKQSGKLQCDEPRLGYSDKEGRRSYSIRQFAAKYKLGEPVAGNFYQAQWDEYVSTLSGHARNYPEPGARKRPPVGHVGPSEEQIGKDATISRPRRSPAAQEHDRPGAEGAAQEPRRGGAPLSAEDPAGGRVEDVLPGGRHADGGVTRQAGGGGTSGVAEAGAGQQSEAVSHYQHAAPGDGNADDVSGDSVSHLKSATK